MNRINFVSSSKGFSSFKKKDLENTSTLYSARQEAILLLQSELIEKEFVKELSKAKEKFYNIIDGFFSEVAKEKLKEISEEKSYLYSIIGTSHEEEIEKSKIECLKFQVTLKNLEVSKIEENLSHSLSIKRIKDHSILYSKKKPIHALDVEVDNEEFPYATLKNPYEFGFMAASRKKKAQDLEFSLKKESEMDFFEFEAPHSSRKKEDKGKVKAKKSKRVARPYYSKSNEYFKENAHKILGIFQESNVNSHGSFIYLDLEDNSLELKSISLKEEIPDSHSSTVTPDGEIYLSGGIFPRIKVEDNKFAGSLFRLNITNERLEEIAKLRIARAHHGMIYSKLLNGILITGGFTHGHSGLEYTKESELYSLSKGSWEEIPPCKLNASDFSLAQHHDYIYKIGGNNNDGKFERYSVLDNTWTAIPCPSYISVLSNPGLLSTGPDLIVFGGLAEGIRNNTSFMLKTEGKHANEFTHYKDLPFGGEFLTESYQYKGEIFMLQNLALEKNQFDISKLLLLVNTQNEWEFVI